ncbi:hypothetical protein QBC35DRAFT_481478 [Podospora australis]|uniref:Deubiquitination-protection protein dph1 n=1 Tax=Podospora australis TaxID=1536484 RepID=A0AAN6X3M1_9PEZI|nr:hypothetical protein QBC35DRAFT_481478 [Podospora australis]
MAESGEAGSDAQITFKVKAGNDSLFTITMPESATVLDLKTKLAGDDYAKTPAESQRLIYSGRILKDADKLEVYKIKNLNTIHLVKGARSNPAATTTASSSSTPATPAVPTNMAAGTSAGNLLAGLTGARFAGHANLPSRDLFGADGGMGAPPNEEQMANLLSDPNMQQTMNEALNNPQFIDYMVQSNPMLANMPNAREMLQSPYFRSLMTNPDSIRMAARLRRTMGGGGFPAPGVTDNTPDAAGAAPGAGNAADDEHNDPFGLLSGGLNPFGAPAFPPGGANPFALFGIPPPAAAAAGTGAATTATPPAAGQTNTPGQDRAGATGAAGTTGAAAAPQGQAAQNNPFAALFGGLPFGAAGAGAGAGGANPFGLPPMDPEMMRQMAQLWGGGSASPAAPPDNRPPEERYADQLRQLNDMGFFDFDRNVAALRRSGGSVQGAIEHLLNGS